MFSFKYNNITILELSGTIPYNDMLITNLGGFQKYYELVNLGASKHSLYQ